MERNSPDGVNAQLRLRCYYCSERIVVDFADMADRESAFQILKSHGWIFGVVPEGARTIFDPICHDCGRSIYASMIKKGGGRISPAAEKAIREMYPELIGALAN